MNQERIKPGDFSAGLMANLAAAAAKAGIRPAELDRLYRDPAKMLQLARLIRADSDCAMDCVGELFIPEGWSYRDEDQIASVYRERLNVRNVTRYLREMPTVGEIRDKKSLESSLESKTVPTAHALHFLLRPENQHLIPEECGRRYTFFWGSVYRDEHGRPCVLYLYRVGGHWNRGVHVLHADWDPPPIGALTT